MKGLILSICMIALPLIAATQKLSKDSASLRKLDTLRIERRLVVLGVTRMEYLQADNNNLTVINHSLNEIISHNVQYIAQLEGDVSALKDVKEKQEKRIRGWRTAALVEGGILVIILALVL